jgi:hypothetical protein
MRSKKSVDPWPGSTGGKPIDKGLNSIEPDFVSLKPPSLSQADKSAAQLSAVRQAVIKVRHERRWIVFIELPIEDKSCLD